MSPFGVIMTVILVGYAVYYGYNIVKDLYFDKSGDVVEQEAVEEKEVDITDELRDFTKFDANEDEKFAKARKEAEAAAKEREEGGFDNPDPTHGDSGEDSAKDNGMSDQEDAQSDDAGEKDQSVGQEGQEQQHDDADNDDTGIQDDDSDVQKADDAEFSKVIDSMKEIGDAPSMSGAMEVDDFEKMDDKQFEEVMFLTRKAA